MPTYKVTFDAIWIYKDKEQHNQEEIVDAENEWNACSLVQYLIGDRVKIEIKDVKEDI